MKYRNIYSTFVVVIVEMKYINILLFALIASCGQTEESKLVEEQKQESTFDPAISQMDLRGEASQFNTSWVPYQKFITELENFDHTTPAAQRLVLAVDDMTVSLPEKISKQPVKSRLKVLETRVKSYHALLTHNSYSKKEQQKRFDELIIALDQLKIQMMEVFLLEKAEENILKNLEESELELEEKDIP